MIDTAKIAESVEQEIEELRHRMRAASGGEVYDHACSIFASEQMACLLIDCQDEVAELFEEFLFNNGNSGTKVVQTVFSKLDDLVDHGCVLSAFVDWFLSKDSVNLSDMEETKWTFQEFIGMNAED